VRIGFYVTGSATGGYRELLDQVEYAEAAGFESVWLRERHFHRDHQGRNFFSSPMVVASAIAARTSRVRIGLGARILPLDHPVRLAEDAVAVDLVSGGRIDLGIARVGENDLYEAAFGRTKEEARGRFEEALEIMLLAWTGERFSYRGEHFSVPEVAVLPRPLQRPHPPLYLVGVSPETLAFGAARGLPLLLAGAQPVAEVKRTREAYRELLADAGHEPEDVRLPLNRFVYVAETAEQAIEETRAAVMGFIGRKGSVIRDFLSVPDGEITERLLHDEVFIFGDADRCLERIEELRGELDVRDLILTFNYFTIDHDRCRRSMERFTEQVLPELRRRPVGVGAGG
jgi:alkanesulfonate monooxygenase SsuD/methylene tetrahydromethanopterin reductase-like flavin-dependent oxidoreductase (luciferase family)